MSVLSHKPGGDDDLQPRDCLGMVEPADTRTPTCEWIKLDQCDSDAVLWCQ